MQCPFQTGGLRGMWGHLDLFNINIKSKKNTNNTLVNVIFFFPFTHDTTPATCPKHNLFKGVSLTINLSRLKQTVDAALV